MKRNYLIVGLVLILILVFATNAVLGQNEDQQISLTPSDSTSVSQAITYQGVLEDSGNPVNGPCDFIYRLDDAPDGTSYLSSVTLLNQTVEDGKFTHTLSFASSFFIAGDDRFLQVEVRCPAGPGDYEIMWPRHQLTPVPYSYYAEFATDAGTADYATDAGTALNATNAISATYAADSDTAAYATDAGTAANATNAVNATNATNATYAANSDLLDGINSSSFSLTSHNHAAQDWPTVSSTYGLRVDNIGSYGLYASGGTYGLYGISTNSIGVYGDGGTGSGDYGGYFTGNRGVRAIGESSFAVEATSTNGDAVRAISTNDDGIYGNGGSGSGDYGGYFTGYSGIYAYGENATAIEGRGPARVIYAYSTDNGDGLRVGSNNVDGAYVWTNQSDNTYGLYSPDSIRALSHVTSLGTSMIVRNGSSAEVQIGDVVYIYGIDEPLAGFADAPTLLVGTEAIGSAGALGIVDTAIVVEMVDRLDESEEGVDSEDRSLDELGAVINPDSGVPQRALDSSIAGPVQPDGLMRITIQGLVQVRVDASVQVIHPGDQLAASPTSSVMVNAVTLDSAASRTPQSGGAFYAIAAEPLSEGTDLIWAFIGGQ